jgi:hypothetical protein
VSTPEKFVDLAVLWTRGSIRCVLKGDGTRYVMEVRKGEKILRAAGVIDEDAAHRVARVWQVHEGRWT